MNDLIREIENADSIAITGHINPDGDCITILQAITLTRGFRYIFRNSRMYSCS